MNIFNFQAFLLTNILFGFIYLVGKSMSGFALMYIILMGISLSHLVIPHIAKAMKKLQQHAGIENVYLCKLFWLFAMYVLIV